VPLHGQYTCTHTPLTKSSFSGILLLLPHFFDYRKISRARKFGTDTSIKVQDILPGKFLSQNIQVQNSQHISNKKTEEIGRGAEVTLPSSQV
jgi:hypothetical protein